MAHISYIVIKFFQAIPFLLDKIYGYCIKKQMKKCGRDVYIRPLSSDFKGLYNLSVGSHVSIPKRTTFYCTEASLTIGDNVIFGPSPTIITGDHNISKIGSFIIDTKEKQGKNDLPVEIGSDVWTGANVTILKGVHVGRGSVIAAGAVLNKSVPPYSIVGGVPARVLKYRFTIEEVLEHERLLYPKGSRYTRDDLEKSRLN